MQRIERTDQILIVAFITLALFPLLYAFRQFDDNTLTNWSWVFRQHGVIEIFLLIAAVTGIAFFLSREAPDPRLHSPILFFAAVLSVVPLWGEPEAILDASRYFLQAKHLELYGPGSFMRAWGSEVSVWTDLPAIPFLYGMAFHYLGETRAVIQGITTLLFALAVVSTYRIGRRLFAEETGLLAGLLLLASPYLLVQVPLMLVDVPTMALLTLSLDAFLTALLAGGPLLLLSPVLIAVTLLAKFSTWTMLAVFPLAAFAVTRRGERPAVRRSLVVLGTAAALAGLLLAAKHDVVAGQLSLLHNYQLPGLGRWRESTLSTFFFQVHPFVAVLAACGIAAAVRKKEIVFVVPAFAAVYVLLLRVERIRYLLPLFPLFSLMAAYGLRELTGDGQVRRFTALSAVGASLVLVFSAYMPFLNSTTMANLRDAGRYLDGLPDETVEVHILPQQRSIGSTEASVPLLDLFTRKRIVRRQEPLPRPDEGKLLSAPLRFTWETAIPSWYAGGPDDRGLTHVIISSGEDAAPFGSAGKQFDKDTGTFRYRTVVTVLERGQLALKAQ